MPFRPPLPTLLPALSAALLLTPPVAAQGLNTADLVRPILQMTAPNWVALRKWEGQDLLYFTQLLPFRCGLEEIRYGLNGAEATERFNAEPCPPEQDGRTFATIEAEAYLPYLAFAPDSIASVTVTIVYDDGEVETHSYDRAAIETH